MTSAPGGEAGHNRHDEIVQFGSGRSPRARWLPRLFLACVVLAAAVVVVVRGAADHGHPRVHASTPARLPPLRVMTTGRRLLGVTGGWELFVRGPDDLVRIELAQGRVMPTFVPPLDSGNSNVAFVIAAHDAIIKSADYEPGYVVPDGRQARQLAESVEYGGTMIPGPAGTQAFWLASVSTRASMLTLTTLTGHRTGPVIRFPPGGPQLVATAVSDGRGDVLMTSGNATTYDAGPGWSRPLPGMIMAVGPASWLVMSCGSSYRRCREEIIDSASGASRLLPGNVSAVPAAFLWPPLGVIAPDGSAAAVVGTDRDRQLPVQLVNLRTARIRDLHVALGSNASDESMAWSPDSRWLFVAAAGGQLVVIDAQTGRHADLGVQLPPVDQVAIRP